MNANVGGFDRAARIIAGTLILTLVFIFEGNVRWWALVGLMPLLTGVLRWCPAYTLLGLNTCPLREKRT